MSSAIEQARIVGDLLTRKLVMDVTHVGLFVHPPKAQLDLIRMHLKRRGVVASVEEGSVNRCAGPVSQLGLLLLCPLHSKQRNAGMHAV